MMTMMISCETWSFVQNEHHTLLIHSEIALRWIKIPAAPFIELWNISIRCAAVWTWTNLKGRSSRRELKIVLLQAVCLSIKYTLLTQESEQGLLLKENQCYVLVNAQIAVCLSWMHGDYRELLNTSNFDKGKESSWPNALPWCSPPYMWLCCAKLEDWVLIQVFLIKACVSSECYLCDRLEGNRIVHWVFSWQMANDKAPLKSAKQPKVFISVPAHMYVAWEIML